MTPENRALMMCAMLYTDALHFNVEGYPKRCGDISLWSCIASKTPLGVMPSMLE